MGWISFFRVKSVLKNRASEEIEEVIAKLALEQLAFGQLRVANELRKRGLVVSPAGVRCVWLRHDLETMKKRLKADLANSARTSLIASQPPQIVGLAKFRE